MATQLLNSLKHSLKAKVEIQFANLATNEIAGFDGNNGYFLAKITPEGEILTKHYISQETYHVAIARWALKGESCPPQTL